MPCQRPGSTEADKGIHCRPQPHNRESGFPNMIRAILALNYFTVGKFVIKQKKGAVGSPASAALCSMVIAVREQTWFRTYRQIIYNYKSLQETSSNSCAGFFCTRYDDNRLLIMPTRFLQLPPLQQFVHDQVYMSPVELEHEPGLDFLGFELDPRPVQ